MGTGSVAVAPQDVVAFFNNAVRTLLRAEGIQVHDVETPPASTTPYSVGCKIEIGSTNPLQSLAQEIVQNILYIVEVNNFSVIHKVHTVESDAPGFKLYHVRVWM